MDNANIISSKNSGTGKKTHKNILNIKTLRLSLKYRPKIFELILKLRNNIKKKNCLIVKLKHQLLNNDLLNKGPQTHKCDNSTKDSLDYISSPNKIIKNRNDVSTQTDDLHNFKDVDSDINTKSTKSCEADEIPSTIVSNNNDETANDVTKTKNDNNWNIKREDGENEKSIADQVKEVAQSVLQQTGMVYVESAGMYYDYKTGYYYNSELGLYYHTNTGCYYYYSEENKTFAFHSYPDRRAQEKSAALIAHEKKKARKNKKTFQKEDDIDNLTKNLSQDKQEDATDEASKPKRRKKTEKKKKETDQNNDRSILKSKIKEQTAVENEIEAVDKEENENKTEVSKGDKDGDGLEDGECSETDDEQLTDDDSESDVSTSTVSDNESVARHHPPSMRVIVRETNIPKLKVGTLFLVTKDGGSVGREGEHHTVLIRDTNVSRHHIDIKYDENRNIYTITDVGSKNGTILNGIRISESQVPSEPVEVQHGSTIQLGETKLLCHVHPGNDTCGHCEPGLVMETQEKETHAAYTRTCSVQKQHKLELARLKNIYAPQPLMIEQEPYKDRAKARREAVGSSHHSEKTQTTDLDTCITAENKGFKLLEKMGWSKGEGLGKNNQGDTAPIPLVSNEGKLGLGTQGAAAAPPVVPPVRVVNTLGPATLRLATKTKMLQPPAKAFQQLTDEDSE